MKYGPNVQKLMARFMAVEAIPPGTPNPFQTGVEYLLVLLGQQRGGRTEIGRHVKRAVTATEAAIAAVKAAPDNPYGDDDEAIAGEIIRQAREHDFNGEMNARLDGVSADGLREEEK